MKLYGIYLYDLSTPQQQRLFGACYREDGYYLAGAVESSFEALSRSLLEKVSAGGEAEYRFVDSIDQLPEDLRQKISRSESQFTQPQ